MYQKIVILGNVGRDPEIRFMGNGNAAGNFSVAVNRRWKDKNSGEQKQQTEWFNVKVFERLAEIAREYVHKGDLILVEGEMRTEQWKDKNGNDRQSVVLYANQLKLMPKGGERQQSREPGSDDDRGDVPAAGQQTTQASQQSADFDDDIPF